MPGFCTAPRSLSLVAIARRLISGRGASCPRRSGLRGRDFRRAIHFTGDERAGAG